MCLKFLAYFFSVGHSLFFLFCIFGLCVVCRSSVVVYIARGMKTTLMATTDVARVEFFSCFVLFS